VPSAFRWEIKVPDSDFRMTTDDLTVDEIESCEEQTQVPWLLMDPSNFKVARAYLAVALIRMGLSDDEAVARIKSWHLADLNGVFTLLPPRKTTKPGKAEGAAVPPTSASS
jgi:hypothetical protein